LFDVEIGPEAAAHAPDAGEACDLVTVPVRQGLEALDILRRWGELAMGPVLHDGPCHTLGFLVPAGTVDDWELPGSACTSTGAFGRGCTPAEPPVVGTRWLLPPEATSAVVTDPQALRDALCEAARVLDAADRHR
jgi:hypothetical protein